MQAIACRMHTCTCMLCHIAYMYMYAILVESACRIAYMYMYAILVESVVPACLMLI